MKVTFNTESQLTMKKINKELKSLRIESYVTGDGNGLIFNEFPIFNAKYQTIIVYGVVGGSNVIIDDNSFFCSKGKLTKKLTKELVKVVRSSNAELV